MMGKLRTLLEFIRIEHNIFSLTFVYAGAFLSVRGIPGLEKLAWITLALVGARSGAIVLGDIADRELDALNPRTRGRHLPSGKVSLREAWAIVLVSYAVLFYSAHRLNPLAFALAPVPLLLAILYPYSKKYTAAAHLVLGLNLAFAPLGGWVGATGSLALPPLILSAAVALWVAGFDIIYACQDMEFDRKMGLHSIPAALGASKAFRASALMHAMTLLLLYAVQRMMGLGLFYLMGVSIIALLLLYEHLMVGAGRLDRVPVAFFHINALVSLAVFTFVALEVLFPVPL